MSEGLDLGQDRSNPQLSVENMDSFKKLNDAMMMMMMYTHILFKDEECHYTYVLYWEQKISSQAKNSKMLWKNLSVKVLLVEMKIIQRRRNSCICLSTFIYI